MPLPAAVPDEALIAEHERLIAEGVPLAEACRATRMSTATYYKWGDLGEASADGSGLRVFYERVFSVRKGMPRVKAASRPPQTRRAAASPRMTAVEKHLSREDLVDLLEMLAQRGNVRAIQLLLERPWERKDEETDAHVSTLDALDNVTDIGSRRKGA